MNCRKSELVSARQTSDLEKRRLEAELKAAQEIAKIKEAVIEKRLAYELATLEDPGSPVESTYKITEHHPLKETDVSTDSEHSHTYCAKLRPTAYRNPSNEEVRKVETPSWTQRKKSDAEDGKSSPILSFRKLCTAKLRDECKRQVPLVQSVDRTCVSSYEEFPVYKENSQGSPSTSVPYMKKFNQVKGNEDAKKQVPFVYSIGERNVPPSPPPPPPPPVEEKRSVSIDYYIRSTTRSIPYLTKLCQKKLKEAFKKPILSVNSVGEHVPIQSCEEKILENKYQDKTGRSEIVGSETDGQNHRLKASILLRPWKAVVGKVRNKLRPAAPGTWGTTTD